MKVLKCNYDVTKGLTGYDEQIKALKEHIEKLHLAVSENGKSYVAIIDRGEGNIRVISGKDMVTMTKFIQDTEKVDGPYVNVQVLTIETLQ